MGDWYSDAREADGGTDEEVLAEIRLRRDGALPCVRCGVLPRDHNVFLCHECRSNPATEQEVLAGFRQGGIRSQRHWLVEHVGWHGKWQGRPHASENAAKAKPAEALVPGRGGQGDRGTGPAHPRAR